MEKIHSTAVVSSAAEIAFDCEIGPYSVIEPGVTIASGCRIGAHVVLRAGTELGENVVVHSGAVLGGEPQDLSFDAAIPSRVLIGAGVEIREAVTVNRSSREGEATTIGSGSFLMACSHVGHDCILGEKVVLANAVLLAGHVHVGSHSFLGGGAGIHQFCRIGESVMLGGNASITFDLPPFTMVADRNRLAGLNLIGLRRRGFPREVIAELKSCLSAVYQGGKKPREAAAAALEDGLAKSEQGRIFLAFFAEGSRGFARPDRQKE